MSLRLLIAVGIVALAAGALGLGLHARGGGSAARVKAGGCRVWLAAPAYRREIASVRPLVPRMKRAFAAPGVSIAIAADGKLVWSESCGFADVARRRAVARTTQFRIGSLSKPFTAATVARLAQQGRLALDDEISKYVPAFPRGDGVPTLRQLDTSAASATTKAARRSTSATTTRNSTACACSSTTRSSLRPAPNTTTRATALTCSARRSSGHRERTSLTPWDRSC